jgi:peptidoglycan hydrolase-like protein with peptidoglycan-binding domain
MIHNFIARHVGSVARRIAFGALAAIFACVAASAALASSPATRHSAPSPQSGHASTQQTKSKKKTTKRHSHRDIGQKVPTTDRIQEIQSALAREGYYKGDPSGKWDEDTQDAMRRFQEEHNMSGSGKLDALSLQKLGLGSDIAGVSAPRPPQPPSEQNKPATSPATTGTTNAPSPTSAAVRP